MLRLTRLIHDFDVMLFVCRQGHCEQLSQNRVPTAVRRDEFAIDQPDPVIPLAKVREHAPGVVAVTCFHHNFNLCRWKIRVTFIAL